MEVERSLFNTGGKRDVLQTYVAGCRLMTHHTHTTHTQHTTHRMEVYPRSNGISDITKPVRNPCVEVV